jgi:hypothetical protein
MPHTNNLVEGVGSSAIRFGAAAEVTRFTRRIAAAIRNSAPPPNAIGQMNDRQLQDVGLWPTRGSRMVTPVQKYK